LEFTTTWLGDGIHAVEYVGTNGDKIEILVNGEKIQGSPFPVKFFFFFFFFFFF